MTLSELPDFIARPGTREPHHTAKTHRLDWRGGAPPRGQPGDAAPAHVERVTRTVLIRNRRAGRHAHPECICSVRAEPIQGKRALTRRMEGRWWWIRSRGSAAIRRDEILAMEVPSPAARRAAGGAHRRPDLRAEMLPQYMWDQRLTARTPMPGVPCGAGATTRAERDRDQRAQRGDGSAARRGHRRSVISRGRERQAQCDGGYRTGVQSLRSLQAAASGRGSGHVTARLARLSGPTPAPWPLCGRSQDARPPSTEPALMPGREGRYPLSGRQAGIEHADPLPLRSRL